MQQTENKTEEKYIKYLQQRLAKKQKQLSKQKEREEELQRVMKNTEEDIDQMLYALHELEKAKTRKRRIISRSEVLGFFARISRLFDYLQRRYHKCLNYGLTCLVIYARYRFSSRTRAPGHEFLGSATILTYFKYEREMVAR